MYARKRGVVFALLAILCFISLASATQVGMNYYHETMMNSAGYHYIDRSLQQVGSDLDDIKTLTNNVKFYMNPLVSNNLDWLLNVNAIAKQKGMHTVVVMNTEDRVLDDSNWQSYRSAVIAAAKSFNGKADEFLVGNEISLHTSFSKSDLQVKVVALINECKQYFAGPVSYEAFWYEKDNWKGYDGRIYFNLYEEIDSFRTNTLEMNSSFGSNAYVGEFGVLLVNNNRLDQDNQASEIKKRWDIIQSTASPIAYIFTYKEPSSTGFGIVDINGVHLKSWDVLKPTTSSITNPTTSSSSLADLVSSCTYNGNVACSKISDSVSGTCRSISFSTSSGPINLLACNKSSGVEIYRQSYPANTKFNACLGSSCVNDARGFAVVSVSTPITNEIPTSNITSTSFSISNLPISCSVNDQACSVKTDVTSGVCRTIVSGSSAGDIKVQSCDKGNGWFELYLQQKPSGTYKFCLANGCVTNSNGFARFQPNTITTIISAVLNVSSLSVSVNPSGAKTGDYMESNGCRKVQFSSSAGWLEALICLKTDKYEMSFLSGTSHASVCVGSSCVNAANRVVSFK